MDVAFEIYTFGGGEFLRMVFLGIVNILDSRAFHTLMAVIALVGFLITLGQGAVNPKKFNHFWILILAGIYISVVIPRTDIQITDTIVTESSAVVPNVPIIVAVPAAFFSQVSKWITDRVEDQFSIPNEISYTNTGYLLGHALLAEMNTMKFSDERVRKNFDEFWRTCVFYDIALGKYSWRELVAVSKEGGAKLVEFIGENTSQVRMFPYIPASPANSEKGNTYLEVCSESWVGSSRTGRVAGPMAKDLEQQKALMYRKGSFKFFNERPINQDADLSRIVGRHASAMPVALSFYTKISQSAADLASTTILGNSLRNGLSGLNSVTDVEGATQEFALNKAQLERSNTFAVMGRVASKFLPMLKNIFGALIYALAPLAILMLMLPMPGKVMIGYLKVLVWINLWDPFYAILHCIMSFYSSSVAQGMSMAEAEGNGDPELLNVFSFVSFTRYSEVMNEHALLAGYLALSVPMMSWMVVQMSGAMMAGLAGRTMQGYEGTVTRASNEITSGNISMGSMNFGNHSIMQEQLAPNTDSHRVSWYDAETGMTKSQNAAGMQFNEQQKSSYISQVNIDESAQRIAQQANSRAITKVEATDAQLQDSQVGVKTAMDNLISERMKSRSIGDNASVGENGQVAEAVNAYQTALKSYADQQGWSQAELDSRVRDGGIGFSLAPTFFGMGAGVRGGAIHGEGKSETKTSGEASQQSNATAEKFDHLKSNIKSALLSEVASSQSGDGDKFSDALSGALMTMKQASQAYSLAVSDQETTQNILSNVGNLTGSIKNNFDDEFNSFALEEYGMSRSAIDNLRVQAVRGERDERDEAQARLQYIQQDFIADKMGLSSFYETPSDLDILKREGVNSVEQFFKTHRPEATSFGMQAQQDVRAGADARGIPSKEENGRRHYDVFERADDRVESSRLTPTEIARREAAKEGGSKRASTETPDVSPFGPPKKLPGEDVAP